MQGGNFMPMSQAKAKRETLNLRIKPELRGLIDRAAALSDKNRTDFVLDAARRAAEDALLDRTVLVVNPKAYAEFVARGSTRHRTRMPGYAVPCRRLRRGRNNWISSAGTPALMTKVVVANRVHS
jgi:uncharacterized protein (DUF1778 family)